MSERRRHLALLGGLTLAAIGGVDARGQTTGTSLPFRATAAATGASVSTFLPGAALSDTLVDVSGPTAQVGTSSIESAVAYAAFPDPGPVILSVPGALTGVLGQGGGGLPPLDLPAPPPYPAAVTADELTPERSVGSGPYELNARSTGSSGAARATGGIRDAATGRAMLVSAVASVDVSAEAVTATATSEAQVVTVGPLTLGQVRSTATMVLEAGPATPRSSATTEITGVQIAGLPVAITSHGLDAAGVAIPLPIAEPAGQILASFGITLELLPGTETDDRVVAPTVRITLPVDGSVVGAQRGRMVIVLGGSTASLAGAAPPSSATTPGLATVQPVPAGPTTAVTTAPDIASGQATDVAGPQLDAAQPPAAPRQVVPTSVLIGLFDIRSLYLLLAGGGIACWTLAQLIRTLGVKSRWTSTTG